jgi:hypothetical protein
MGLATPTGPWRPNSLVRLTQVILSRRSFARSLRVGLGSARNSKPTGTESQLLAQTNQERLSPQVWSRQVPCPQQGEEDSRRHSAEGQAREAEEPEDAVPAAEDEYHGG